MFQHYCQDNLALHPLEQPVTIPVLVHFNTKTFLTTELPMLSCINHNYFHHFYSILINQQLQFLLHSLVALILMILLSLLQPSYLFARRKLQKISITPFMNAPFTSMKNKEHTFSYSASGEVTG
jgi:hypothetical protein